MLPAPALARVHPKAGLRLRLPRHPLAILACCLCCGMLTASPGGRQAFAEGNRGQTAGRGPAMHFDRDTHDFGLVQQGQKLRHIFTYTNPGTQSLRILQVKPTCGCTRVGSWDAEVAPGGRGTIVLELDTQGMLDQIRKKVLIQTNSSEEPEKTLWLQCRVNRGIRIVPAAAVFGLLEPERPKTRRIDIIHARPEPFSVEVSRNYAPGFTVHLKEIKAGRHYRLVITSSRDLITGPQTGGVMLQARTPAVIPVWVPICAYVAADWDVRPRKILLPAVPRPGSAHKTLYLRPVRNPRRKIQGLTSNIPGFGFTLRKEFWRSVYRVRLDFPENFTPAGSREWRISLQTDDPDFPQLVIPVAADGNGAQAGAGQE